MRLAGKVAIVSGGGSATAVMGNGKATAILFAREGAKVAVVDLRYQAAQDTVDVITGAGGEAVAVEADVTRETGARRAVEATIARYGKLDILFNNVGIAASRTVGLDVTEEEWDVVMNTNLKSVLFMCQSAVPEMVKNGGGTIVNNASLAAFYAHHVYAYAASKAGVVALTKCLASGLGKHNIRVNCVCPGLMNTSMAASIQSESRMRTVAQRIPLRRQGTAEETAQAVLFLASSESAFVTGQAILLDGGHSIT